MTFNVVELLMGTIPIIFILFSLLVLTTKETKMKKITTKEIVKKLRKHCNDKNDHSNETKVQFLIENYPFVFKTKEKAREWLSVLYRSR